MRDRRTFRMQVLANLGADPVQVEELLSYNQTFFQPTDIVQYPLPDEPFVGVWENYAREVEQAANIGLLSKYLVQLRFPVRAGMSQNADYLAATRRGVNPDDLEAATGLLLRPEQCQLLLHSTPAGRIPLLIAETRQDFVLLVQALAKRNEPVPIPDSMGASMVAGYNNWHRIQLLRSAFEASNPSSSWDVEFQRIKEQKSCYQDRFIILSRGPYSGVPASDLGLQPEEWRSISLAIRREHECAHYFTRRVFGSMRNNLIDELIADYWAISTTLNHFQADWFLRFFGLEAFPRYRVGGRLQNYRGDPALSDGAFVILQRLVKHAAENLARFDGRYATELRQSDDQPALFLALSAQTVEEIASEDGANILSESFLHSIETIRAGLTLQDR
jgi:hypothetical protein